MAAFPEEIASKISFALIALLLSFVFLSGIDLDLVWERACSWGDGLSGLGFAMLLLMLGVPLDAALCLGFLG